jgi:hypothetical protein
VVLGKLGSVAQRQAVRNLLTDVDAKVRLRAAQSLLAARDKEALRHLLPLLNEAPLEVARQVEDTLGLLAGDKAPATPLGEDEAARQKCRAAWEGWWKENEKKLDLANADLPWLNPGQRARAATLQFVNALLKGDMATLKKSTDFPFSLAGHMTFTTRPELDKFLEETFNRGERPKLSFSVTAIKSLEEYLKTIQGPQKDFAAGLPRAAVRVVWVQIKYEGQNREEKAAILVRLRGGQGRVIGIGDPQNGSKPR